ncbi:SH3 domain-binding protein 1 [Brienomyrus brachyistius]|uniref:SH3 domain-binding protein 1 n=1 Tax=Brienomyrus brachyistius TaxID=42636 RepID=UPI0020B3D0D4|nr:SH3 domain-binding protein 1 [Brienomyrus brachyistius]XP_048870968.1 SH3 domain-binding protein 1 [Brienomyrus brachyistius]XP_048870969.1 SH3 domain-binding protein 1 [Brienomyrus brachyistius]XP_048870970.1 SH3 domain-binding protein 1 [Brienomyrus brachyistius]XP_048870971.1 SH3 domain-binding protein 1 [Brienomyrus brachyistius]
MLNRLKQLGYGYKLQDATHLLEGDLVLVEQRVEPARRAAQVIHKKLVTCLQSQQGLDSERRMKKLPLMMLSVSMADSFKDFDADSSIRKVLEMCCFMQSFLAKTLADYEVQLEKEVLEPLNKLSEEDLPEILRNKKQFAKLMMDWHNARNRAQASTGAQAKQDGLREEVEEAWRRLESMKNQYSADLYHFASKEDDYANYFIRLLELQVGFHKTSLEFLQTNLSELKNNYRNADTHMDSPSGKVYGVPLMSHLLESGREIAMPIEECVHMLLNNALREEGLFRLAAAATVVKQLKKSLDCGDVDHSKFAADPHAVAGALKSYLRELPEPLMTFELYSEWFKAAGEKEVQGKLERLKAVLQKLPQENYNNLRYLVQFLARLSEQQTMNLMTPSNIAIVLGPNLLWPRTEGGESLLDMASASSVQVVTVVEPLIQYAQSLFPEAEDFEIPELPAIPDVAENQSHLPQSGAEDSVPATSPCSPPADADSFMGTVKSTLFKTASWANCSASWEDPSSELCRQSHSQNPTSNQDQPQSPPSSQILTQTSNEVLRRKPSLRESAMKQPTHMSRKFSAPCTAQSAVSRHRPNSKQQQPSAKSQIWPKKKPKGPPSYPPPQPPPSPNQQLPTVTQHM